MSLQIHFEYIPVVLLKRLYVILVYILFKSYADAIDLPLFQREIQGHPKSVESNEYVRDEEDEVEDLYYLLKSVKQWDPEVRGMIYSSLSDGIWDIPTCLPFLVFPPVQSTALIRSCGWRMFVSDWGWKPSVISGKRTNSFYWTRWLKKENFNQLIF